MDTRDITGSGNLELYVYGLLPEDESKRIASMAAENNELREEILQIESAVIDLSSAFSPFLPASVYRRISNALFTDTPSAGTTETQRGVNWGAWTGWAAAVLFLLGVGYLYKELDERNDRVADIEKQKSTLEEAVVTLEDEKKAGEAALSIVRDPDNTIVALAGQAVSPESAAKVYWNKQTRAVHIDAAGLPRPPQGMVYQVWALKLNPLTPVSIGLLENFEGDQRKLFAVAQAAEAEAVGITLEPAGGSATPTLEQLYVLGKV